jgi:hypothetical protein
MRFSATLITAVFLSAGAHAGPIEDALQGGYVILPGDRFLDLIEQEPVDPPDPPKPDPSVVLHDFGADYDFSVVDAQDSDTYPATWGDSFRGWKVRHLEGNSDDVQKIVTLPFTHLQTEQGLVLRAGYHAGQLIGGMISAQDWMAVRRGAIEFRARITNIPNGYHFASWTLPTNNAWPPEIDMLEVVQGRNNGSNGKAHFNRHAVGGAQGDVCHGPAEAYQGICFAPTDDDWHVYRLEATDDGLKWLVDGELVRSSTVPLAEPHYWLATWEGDSVWPGPITDRRAVASVEIDYFRIETEK